MRVDESYYPWCLYTTYEHGNNVFVCQDDNIDWHKSIRCCYYKDITLTVTEAYYLRWALQNLLMNLGCLIQESEE